MRKLISRGGCIDKPCYLGARIECKLGISDGRAGRVRVGGGSTLERDVILNAFGGEITISENVYIGPFVVIYGHGGVQIGANSLVSMHCRILSSNHTIPSAKILIRSQPDIRLATYIGADVWLGAGVTILGGVTIGDGCIIGAGSVVSRNLPPYSIAVGVPARVVGSRP
jgi:acetyltransferase-like isoleucine patch superfamily enzyme